MDFLSAGEFSAGSAGHRETEREELTRAHTQVLSESSTAVNPNTNIRNPPANTERSPAENSYFIQTEKQNVFLQSSDISHSALKDDVHH